MTAYMRFGQRRVINNEAVRAIVSDVKQSHSYLEIIARMRARGLNVYNHKWAIRRLIKGEQGTMKADWFELFCEEFDVSADEKGKVVQGGVAGVSADLFRLLGEKYRRLGGSVRNFARLCLQRYPAVRVAPGTIETSFYPHKSRNGSRRKAIHRSFYTLLQEETERLQRHGRVKARRNAFVPYVPIADYAEEMKKLATVTRRSKKELAEIVAAETGLSLARLYNSCYSREGRIYAEALYAAQRMYKRFEPASPNRENVPEWV